MTHRQRFVSMFDLYTLIKEYRFVDRVHSLGMWLRYKYAFLGMIRSHSSTNLLYLLMELTAA